MPRTSNVQLSQETQEELEKEFFEFLNSLPSGRLQPFLSEFLTKEEKMMLFKRLALYWALLEGLPHSQIQKMLGVSHDTTRIYNAQKNKLSEEFKEAIRQITLKKTMPADAPVEVKEAHEALSDEQTISMEDNIMTDEIESEDETPKEDITVSEVIESEVIAEEPVQQSSEESVESQPATPAEDSLSKDQSVEKNGDESPSAQASEGEIPKKKSGIAKFFGF